MSSYTSVYLKGGISCLNNGLFNINILTDVILDMCHLRDELVLIYLHAFMENRCVSLWEMKQFNYESRHIWILKYIAAMLQYAYQQYKYN